MIEILKQNKPINDDTSPSKLSRNDSYLLSQQAIKLSLNKSQLSIPKHLLLYEEAKQRNFRQDVIYSNCIDKECTFKPKLIT